MKFFVLAAVLSSTFVVAFGAKYRALEQRTPRTGHLTAEEATKYCNSMYPVTEDPRQKITHMVIDAESIPEAHKFHNTEWCHLYCFLEKVGFFGPDGSMQVRRILKHTTSSIPDLEAGSAYLLMRLYVVDRTGRGIKEKCSKAFIQYYRYIESILTSTLAADMDADPIFKEKIADAIAYGNELPTELEASIDKTYNYAELLYKKSVEPNARMDCAM